MLAGAGGATRPRVIELGADRSQPGQALIRKTLGPLREAGLVTVGRGPGAGWSLARPAERIRLDEVHEALEEKGMYALHPHDPNQDCPVGFGIRPVLAQVYADADAAVRRSLQQRTVGDVLDTLLAEHPLPVDPR